VCCSDNCGLGKRNISRRKHTGKIEIEVRTLFVKVDRSLGVQRWEGLGLRERNVEQGRESVWVWVGAPSWYRWLGAGSARFHVRCRWDARGESDLSVMLLVA
jgi:hypothetical protein